MGALYDELKKIPWYHFSERKAQKQKIEELRIKRLDSTISSSDNKRMRMRAYE